MMKTLTPLYTLLVLFLLFSLPLQAQTSCGDCIIDLPELPEDTLFLTLAPDGQANAFYDADISFRVPMTTTPVAAVDSTVQPGITIDHITINTLTNLPPGLEWELSQSDFDTSEETDGCIKFCGTPLQPGLYEVEVIITATVLIFDQTTSFTFPINILPASSSTEGFSMTNNSGCGAVTVSFTNNIPSNGAEGFSYFWDFGNGNTSLDENPFDQTYTEPGIYEVMYEANIDTIGYILTNIVVESVGCNDLLSRPDLKIDVIDPEGELIFVTDIMQNTDPPVSWSFNLPILEGNYTIQVVDDDSGLGGADDICGTFNINQSSNGTLVDGETTIELTILNPIQTINSVDSVFVFEQPSDPVINNLPAESLCQGDTVTLSTNYNENLQWYMDSVSILGAVDSFIQVQDSGTYWVVYTSIDGCIASSEQANIEINENPTSPVFVNENNLLTLFSPGALPDNFALQWYLNGELIDGATEAEYCIPESGTYMLVVTDLDSECSNFYDLSINYNPDFENCVSATDEFFGLAEELRLYPNPTAELAIVNFRLLESGNVSWALENAIGQTLIRELDRFGAGEVTLELNLGDYPAGLYLIKLGLRDKIKTLKLIKL